MAGCVSRWGGKHWWRFEFANSSYPPKLIATCTGQRWGAFPCFGFWSCKWYNKRSTASWIGLYTKPLPDEFWHVLTIQYLCAPRIKNKEVSDSRDSWTWAYDIPWSARPLCQRWDGARRAFKQIPSTNQSHFTLFNKTCCRQLFGHTFRKL